MPYHAAPNSEKYLITYLGRYVLKILFAIAQDLVQLS